MTAYGEKPHELPVTHLYVQLSTSRIVGEDEIMELGDGVDPLQDDRTVSKQVPDSEGAKGRRCE